jgi:hypothetical protein
MRRIERPGCIPAADVEGRSLDGWTLVPDPPLFSRVPRPARLTRGTVAGAAPTSKETNVSEQARVVRLDWLLANYRPGSRGSDWTWQDEEADLHSMPCLCLSRPSEGRWTVCPMFGHYQRRLEAHIAQQGRIDQPICLGSDGRVWDGHHRITAARRLGIETIPVEAF